MDHIRSESQEKVKSIIDEKSKALAHKLESEKNQVRKERDEKVAELAKKQNEMKSYYESELDRVKNQKETEIERLRSRGEMHLKNIEHQYDEMMKSRDEMLGEERRTMLNETQSLRQLHQKNADQALKMLKEDIEDRYNNHVRGIESQLARTQSDRTTDLITQQRIQNLSRKHLIEDYENRIAKLHQNLDEARQDTLEKNRIKVDQALKMNDGILQDTNQRKKQEINLLRTQARDDRASLESLMKNKIQHEKTSADRRVERLLRATQEQREAEQQYFKNNLSAMRESFSNKLQDQRELKIDELRNIQIRAEEKLKEMDKRYQQTLDQTVRFYESQIQDLKDKQKEEKLAMNKTNEAKIKNLIKNQKEVQDSLVTKYENKIQQISDYNQKEIDRIEKRYQEQLNALNQRLKWANRGKS
jgi:hypothetical protein